MHTRVPRTHRARQLVVLLGVLPAAISWLASCFVASTMKPKRIMVVDDSHTVLEWVRVVLSRMGWEVIGVATTLGVGALILRERPDLVLIDLEMPTLSGQELVGLTRRNVALRDTHLLLHS